MPQLDFAFYPSQLFWLAITFAILYAVLAYIALPRLKNIQTARDEATQGRREQAGQAAIRAEEALKNYEKHLAESKARTQAEAQKLRHQTDEKLQKERHAAKIRIDKKITEAESDIASFHLSGKKEAEQAAIIAAQEIARHLAGLDVSAEDALSAIKNAEKVSG